ncbi:hypothetical protein [Nocardiopsis alborubida]|uniref:Uncharacterized protein n=1 Tax=Nocardiopsis alborubida TaxID=146802 RepID=A0A7X6MAV0_9ACTN|nr:hypothetical protein [Nocardiopsis alborubida]NKY97189.1 hypothetical protein [Nocardiopsis alborubida]
MAASPDRFGVVDTFSSQELPEDLRSHAKSGVPRKVGRLLERAFYAPFIAARRLHERLGEGTDLERFALFTVSNWDPSIPVPDYATEEAPDRVERLSRFYMHPANPTDWLRRMPNNPLCNICITTGYRGATMHYTGGAESLSLLTTVAMSTLANGTSSGAMIIAFDLPSGNEHVLAEESSSLASAVVLMPSAGAPEAGALARSAAELPGATAVTAMERFIEEHCAREAV